MLARTRVAGDGYGCTTSTATPGLSALLYLAVRGLVRAAPARGTVGTGGEERERERGGGQLSPKFSFTVSLFYARV